METKTENKREKKGVMNAEVNPLKNEKIFVRFVPQPNNKLRGLADGAEVTLCVPILRSTGKYKNVLTNEEKDFLEKKLGLDYNALSVYNLDNNFWDDYKIVLTNEGIHLDLSDPEDYIKYKVLLANTEVVAPSAQERMDRPKVSYKFELVREGDETSLENAKMDATMACYMEFGKIDHDFDTMRTLVELLDMIPYGANSKPEFFRSRINILIQSNPKKFLSYIKDPMLHTKVVIKRATELGKLSKRGDYYYLASDGRPLCENGENPTLSIAAKYLNLPANQDIKFLLESEVDKNRVNV